MYYLHKKLKQIMIILKLIIAELDKKYFYIYPYNHYNMVIALIIATFIEVFVKLTCADNVILNKGQVNHI